MIRLFRQQVSLTATALAAILTPAKKEVLLRADSDALADVYLLVKNCPGISVSKEQAMKIKAEVKSGIDTQGCGCGGGGGNRHLPNWNGDHTTF